MIQRSDLRFVVNAPSDAMRGGPDAGPGAAWTEGQAVGIEWADHALMRLHEPAPAQPAPARASTGP